MKIDEACIDHNAISVIEDMIGNPFEYIEANSSPGIVGAVEIGAVYGIIYLAKELKAVLKA